MAELAKEVENGRLLRLLVKLGFVNERPGKDVVSWGGSERHLCVYELWPFGRGESDWM